MTIIFEGRVKGSLPKNPDIRSAVPPSGGNIASIKMQAYFKADQRAYDSQNREWLRIYEVEGLPPSWGHGWVGGWQTTYMEITVTPEPPPPPTPTPGPDDVNVQIGFTDNNLPQLALFRFAEGKWFVAINGENWVKQV